MAIGSPRWAVPRRGVFFFENSVDCDNSNSNTHTVESVWGSKQPEATTDSTLFVPTNKPMAVNYNLKRTLGGGNLWKWVDGEEKVFTVVGPIRAGRAVANPRNGIAKAPDIMTVRDAADGNEKEILVGQVLKSTLVETYPDDSYVGVTFACTQGAVPAGKRYKTMIVNEVEIDEPPAPAKKSKK